MKKWMSLFLALVLSCALFVGCSPAEEAQPQPATDESKPVETISGENTPKDIAWPTQSIQILVGANAGGGIDTAARLIAKYMEQELGVSIVISNMAGGAGSIAATEVKNANPDGYTLLVCHEALLTNKISGTTDFDYDQLACGGIPFKVYTTCLLSKNYKTFEELIEAAKANPGALKFGTELATNETAIAYMIEDAYGVDLTLVDAGAVSDQTAAMMGDHIDFMKAPIGNVKDYVNSGDFSILAFFSEQRVSAYPDVPTTLEKNVDYIVDKYFGCFFPKGTDQAIVDKWAAALEKVCQNPDFLAEAENLMYTVDYVAPADCPAYLEDCKSRLYKYQEVLDTH